MSIGTTFRIVCALTFGFCASLAGAPALAEETGAAKKAGEEHVHGLPPEVVTSHTITVAGERIAFLARAGAVRLHDAQSGAPRADVAYVSYERAEANPLERPVVADPSRDHLSLGQAFDYPDRPPAAGPHDPSPLPDTPHVYERPVSETRAVHNLEHAFVVIWYRQTGEGGLSAEAVSALEGVARDEGRVIMAPYPDLPAGRALALLAWNTRWTCPPTIDADQAVTMARAFIQAFRGTTNAPEAPRGLVGKLLGP